MRDLRDEVVALIDEGSQRAEFDVPDSQLTALAILGAIRMTAVVGNRMGGSAKRLSDLLLGGLARRDDPRPELKRNEQSFMLGEAS
jgi:hypothetical protein